MTFRTEGDEPARQAARKTFRSAGEKPVRKQGVVEDTTKSFLAGIPQGIVGLIGMQGDMRDLTTGLIKKFTGANDEQAAAAGRAMDNFTEAAKTALLPGYTSLGVPSANSADIKRGVAQIPVVGKTAAKVVDRQPQTRAGRFAQVAGMMAPNALAGPGAMAEGLIPQAVARTGAVLVPALASEGAGQAAEAMGASPEVATLARIGGGLAGGAAAGLRPTRGGVAPEARALARQGLDTEAMSAEAAKMRAAGVEPTFTDVSGESGRRYIRAVGVTSPQAGEVLQNRSRVVTSTAKPAVMARTRQLTGEPRTAEQVATDLRLRRDSRAASQYGPAYAEPVQLTPEAVAALRGPDGQAAIQRAIRGARARQDYNTMSELEGLLTLDLDNLSTVSAGALDRVKIAMGERGATLRDRGSRDIASGLFQRQAALDQALENTPGLAPARKAYRDATQAINVAEDVKGARLDVFSTDPADYGRWLKGLSPEATQANQVAIRQEILDTLGGQRSNTFGSIDELASSEYARANLKQALGAAADPYLANLEARLAQVRNASFVSPNAGSRTGVLESDTKGLSGLIDVGKKVLRRDVIGLAQDWLKTRGLRPQTARAIADLATNPGSLDDALAQIESALGKDAARQFLADLTARNALITSAVSASAAEQQ